jgi:hypothetical protein
MFTFIKDINEFTKRVGLLRNADLSEYGIVADSITGDFWGNRIDELIAICAKHPDLHIISVLGYFSGKANHFVPGCKLYYLGRGDANSNLIYSIATRRGIENLYIARFNRDQSRAKGCQPERVFNAGLRKQA